jgi:hypothetical protein
MVVFVLGLAKFSGIHQPGELIEMKHRLVPAVLAVERDVLAEVHIFEVERNKTAVAPLHAAAKFCKEVIVTFGHGNFEILT